MEYLLEFLVFMDIEKLEFSGYAGREILLQIRSSQEPSMSQRPLQ